MSGTEPHGVVIPDLGALPPRQEPDLLTELDDVCAVDCDPLRCPRCASSEVRRLAADLEQLRQERDATERGYVKQAARHVAQLQEVRRAMGDVAGLAARLIRELEDSGADIQRLQTKAAQFQADTVTVANRQADTVRALERGAAQELRRLAVDLYDAASNCQLPDVRSALHAWAQKAANRADLLDPTGGEPA